MSEILIKKELYLKHVVDNNLLKISEIFNIPLKKSKDFYCELFINTFHGFNYDFNSNFFIFLNIKKFFANERFSDKQALNFSNLLSNILNTTKLNLEELSFKKIKNEHIFYKDKALNIEYLYEDTLIQKQIEIFEKNYNEIYQNTKSKSALHTNHIFLRYFYTFDFGGNHLVFNDYESLKNYDYQLECFASSINRSLPYFCALYKDIDCYSNGYMGNFLYLKPEDLMEINWNNKHIKMTFHPPYYKIFIEVAVIKLYEILSIMYNKHNFSFNIHVLIPYDAVLFSFFKKFENFWNLSVERKQAEKFPYFNHKNKQFHIVRDTLKIILTSK